MIMSIEQKACNANNINKILMSINKYIFFFFFFFYIHVTKINGI